MKKPLFFKSLLLCVNLILSTLLFAQAPANDNCANAKLIVTDSACVTGTSRYVGETLTNATEEGYTITSACSHISNARDVWYRFVAKTKNPTITISSQGTGWSGIGNVRIQLLSGSCGSFTEVACGVGPSLTPSLNNPLTEGATYYIRIHKNLSTSIGANHTFTICVTDAFTRASRMREVFSRTVLSGINAMHNPWEVTYGPDNYLWVTEARGYKVHRIDPNTGAKTTVLDLTSASTDLSAWGADSLRAVSMGSWSPWPQGGLAGLALHPNFLHPDSSFVYLSYVHRQISGNFFRNKLVRFTYNSGTGKLGSPIVLCDTLPGSNDHNSQRMIIAPVTPGGPKYLFYASGDMGSGQGGNRLRPIYSQVPDSYEGKILRFNLVEDNNSDKYDKWIPDDNPYNTILGKQSAVWNIGQRNNQGFAYDSVNNILYGSSHGAYSDDEINIIQGFKNYGHPLIIGYADGNYDGNSVQGTSTSYSAGSPFPTSSGVSTCPPIGSESGRVTEINAMGYGNYVDPLFSAYVGAASGTNSVKYIWSNNPTPNNSGWPSEGWSGLDLYTHKIIPGWKQSLIAAGLKWGRLIRLKLGSTGTTTLPSNQSNNNTGDTVLYLQSSNRYRDIAFGPNGRDIYVIMDRNASSVATDGNPPVTPACADCLIKYSFLGYADAGGKSTISPLIDVTAGQANQCNTGTMVTIDGTNNYLWVPITGPDGNILAEIKANGQNLGTITSSFYINSGSLRQRSGVKYLDRNITITPAVQPSSPVAIRLYFTKAEFDALDADPFSGISSISGIRILKNNDPCGAAFTAAATIITPTYAEAHGADGYMVQANISSFSSFYFASQNITLPLNLITFRGTLQNNATLLQWQTANEVNTSHFIVERSVDGRTFTGIGTVAAAGNSAGSVNYSYLDNDINLLGTSTIYYRLKMVDADAAFTYSAIITIILNDITGKITVYPNPAESEINVTITSAQAGIMQWKLMDNTGRVVLYNTKQLARGDNNVRISIDKLPSGIYYFTVSGAGLSGQKIKISKL